MPHDNLMYCTVRCARAPGAAVAASKPNKTSEIALCNFRRPHKLHPPSLRSASCAQKQPLHSIMPSEPSEAGSFEEPTPFEADGSCIYSSSPPDHEAVLPLPFFQNQVAGHTGVSNEGGSILVPEPGKLAKPVGHGYFAGEDHFYRQLKSYPALADFCPAYFGTRTFGQRQFVVLEDLTHGMERPLVVDIKVGTCTVAPDAAWTKRITHLAKDRATTTRSLGLRLVGAQTALRRYGKSWGKGLQPGDMSEALRMCFSVDGRLCVSALSAFVPQLQRLAQVLVDGPRWQLVSSSILFVFQADEDPLATAPRGDPPIPPCPSTPPTFSPSATLADAPPPPLPMPPPSAASPASAAPKPAMRVIDFAHAYPLRCACDAGYLYGLTNLIYLLSDLLHADRLQRHPPLTRTPTDPTSDAPSELDASTGKLSLHPPPALTAALPSEVLTLLKEPWGSKRPRGCHLPECLGVPRSASECLLSAY